MTRTPYNRNDHEAYEGRTMRFFDEVGIPYERATDGEDLTMAIDGRIRLDGLWFQSQWRDIASRFNDTTQVTSTLQPSKIDGKIELERLHAGVPLLAFTRGILEDPIPKVGMITRVPPLLKLPYKDIIGYADRKQGRGSGDPFRAWWLGRCSDTQLAEVLHSIYILDETWEDAGPALRLQQRLQNIGSRPPGLLQELPATAYTPPLPPPQPPSRPASLPF